MKVEGHRDTQNQKKYPYTIEDAIKALCVLLNVPPNHSPPTLLPTLQYHPYDKRPDQDPACDRCDQPRADFAEHELKITNGSKSTNLPVNAIHSPEIADPSKS